MAYDTHLESRLENLLLEKQIPHRTMKMMGGLCFMVDEKMCFVIVKDNLMARIGAATFEAALKIDGCSEINHKGAKMNDFVLVSPDALDMEKDLAFWVEKCLAFNPLAKASKKKKN